MKFEPEKLYKWLHLYPGVDKPGEEHFVVEEASAECIFDVISVSCGCRPTRALGTPNWKAGTRKKQKSSLLPCDTHTIIPPKKTPAACQGTQQENTASKIRFTPKAL